MKSLRSFSPKQTVIVLIVITAIVRMFIAAYTGLGVGESYYWRGARHLDWSYFDQPPLFFWLGGLSIRLLDLSNFSLRLPSILLFAGTTWLLFQSTRKMFNARAGMYAVILLNVSFVFTVPVAAWFQPDAPLMFFWMLTLYCLLQIFMTDELSEPAKIYKWWLLAGVSLGLTMLSKYHAIFMVLGVGCYVFANRDQRKWLLHPGPYLALIVSLLFLFPVLYWNAEHNWISFTFQGTRAGTTRDWSVVRFLGSVLGQMAWIAPWIWIPLIGCLIYSARHLQVKVYSLIFWISVFPIAFFTIIALWARIGFHFHWQAPGYLILFIALGEWTNKGLAGATFRNYRRWLRFSVATTIAIVSVLVIHMTTGFWYEMGPERIARQFGINNDPTIEGVDFDHIRSRFEAESWMDDDNIFVASVKWWQAGKIDWALKGEKDILTFHRDPRNHAYFFNPQSLLGKDAIAIRYESENDISDNLRPFFDSTERLDDIEITRYGKTELKLNVFYCRNFQIPADPMDHLPLYRQLTGNEPF